MTPCEKIGLKVGDEVRLTKEGEHCSGLNTEETLILDRDDGSDAPYFRLKNSGFVICLLTDGFGTEAGWFEMIKTEAEKRGAKFGTMGVEKATGKRCVWVAESLVLPGYWEIDVEGTAERWHRHPEAIRLDHESEFKEVPFCEATHEQRMIAENVHDDMGCQAKEVFYSEFQNVYHYVINRRVLSSATPDCVTFHVKVPS